MRLKRLRVAKDWSQEQVARRAKITRVYVAQLEAGTKSPTVRILERLAKALAVPVTELLE